MSFFTRFSLRNPIAVLILSLLVTVGGYFSATKFKQEQMPDVEQPMILVSAVYPGAAPNEVVNQVTIPLEKTLRNIEGVKNVISRSSNSTAVFQLEFGFSDDMKEKKAAIEEAVNGVKLPTEVDRPKVERLSMSSQPIIYSSVVAAGSTSQEELNDIVKNKVVPTLQGIDGVGNVQVLGTKDDGIFLQLDSQKLNDKKVSFQQVSQVLQANNLSIPLGEATFNRVKEPVAITGNLKSIDAIKNLIVSPLPEVHLKDIADVKIGNDSTVISRTDGKPSVGVNIVKTGDANTVQVSEKAIAAIDTIKQDGKISFEISYDRAKDVKESIGSMLREGGLGALFASLLILLFLRNIRATIIAIVSIPLSIMIALIFMKSFTDVTLNIMTLGGMAVATGRVVDDSIVVIENIVRRLQTEKISKEVLLSATKEVGSAITSSTLTTVAVFAPLAFVSGIIGKVFAPFAMTVAFSLIASLLVALTVVPLMSWALMRKSVPKEHTESAVSKNYKKVLNWSLNHKAVVLLISFVLFLGSLPLAGLAGVTFIPESDYKYVFGTLKMPKGTSLPALDEKVHKIDEQIRQNSEVQTTQVTVGTSFGASGQSSETNVADWFIRLQSDSNTDTFIEDMQKAVTVEEGSEFKINKDGAGGGISVVISGGSIEDIRKATELATNSVKQVAGTANIKNNLQEGTKGIEIQVRPEDAAKNGLSVMQASSMLRPFLSETKIGRVGDGKTASELYLSIKGNSISSIADIEKLSLQTPLGKSIQVKDIADVKEVQLAGSVQLRNGDEYATVSGSITDKDTNKVSAEVKKALDGITFPKGVSYEMGGSSKEIQDMFKDMAMAMAVAIGMVFIVMTVALGEARAPFAILFSLPFAATGGLLGTVLTGEPISISSLIGFLMLIGIVVTNAIVLIDRVQQQVKTGTSIRQSLLEAGGVRLRPILMTAIATICALLPLALGLGGATIISKGLAVIVIGGIATSTLLTLLIVPIMYELLYFKRARRERAESKLLIKEKPVLA